MLDVQRILFPTDFSACAEGAYRHAALLAHHTGAELHLLHVAEADDPPMAWPDADSRVSMGAVFADLGVLSVPGASDLDLTEVVAEEVEGRRPAEAIVEYARDEEADLVVMGTHGRSGWRRGVLGSVAEAVVRHAPCPVLTVRPRSAYASGDAPWPPRRVLLAVDAPDLEGAAPSLAARWATRLAHVYRAPLDIVHVMRPPAVSIADPRAAAQGRTRARNALLALANTLCAESDAALSVQVTVRSGDPIDVIQAVARENHAHLLVVGSHGRRGPRRALLGSVAEALLRSAPCPTLVVRRTPPRPVRSLLRTASRVDA